MMFRDCQKITGEKIYLKKLKLTDVSQDYCDRLNDQEVNKDLAVKSWTIAELKNYAAKKINDSNCFFTGIFDGKNDLQIGTVKLEPINWRKKEAGFGLLIYNKNYWGQGIGVEATKLMVDYAFDKLGLKRINLIVYLENKPAVKVYEKAGFKISRIKKDVKRGAKIYDEATMSISQ